MAHKPQQRPTGSSHRPTGSASEQFREKEADIAKRKADERRKTDYTVDPYRYNN